MGTKKTWGRGLSLNPHSIAWWLKMAHGAHSGRGIAEIIFTLRLLVNRSKRVSRGSWEFETITVDGNNRGEIYGENTRNG